MKYVTAQNGRPDMNSLNEGCPEILKNIIVSCVAANENNRPTFKNIIETLKGCSSSLL